MLLYCFIQLSKPGPQVGNDRLGINGGVVKPVSHRQTFYGSRYRVLDALDYWITLTRLRILDVLCSAELRTPGDE